MGVTTHEKGQIMVDYSAEDLTLEEKASLTSGSDFWNTQAVERVGVPAVMVTDGPHGLRKQTGATDNLGFADSVPATCFPPGRWSGLVDGSRPGRAGG